MVQCKTTTTIQQKILSDICKTDCIFLPLNKLLFKVLPTYGVFLSAAILFSEKKCIYVTPYPHLPNAQ